jgi:hypothetical protein
VAVAGVVTVLFVALAIGFSVFDSPHLREFWSNFVSNALSSWMVVIGGVPVGLGISHWQSRRSDETAQRERERAAKANSDEVLALLVDEIGLNQVHFADWREFMKSEAPGCKLDWLVNHTWEVLKTGGDLKALRNRDLLLALTAYYHRCDGFNFLARRLFEIHSSLGAIANPMEQAAVAILRASMYRSMMRLIDTHEAEFDYLGPMLGLPSHDTGRQPTTPDSSKTPEKR